MFLDTKCVALCLDFIARTSADFSTIQQNRLSQEYSFNIYLFPFYEVRIYMECIDTVRGSISIKVE